MPEDEPETPNQELWRTQEDEAMTMLATDQVCARAQFFEKESLWLFRGVIALTLLIAPAYVYRLITVHNP